MCCKSKKSMFFVVTAILFIHVLLTVDLLGGTSKTGSGYEIMADLLEKAGTASLSNGDTALYQALGQQIGYETMSNGDYALTGGFLGVVDETPPTIQFIAPVQGDRVTEKINILGTVFDENGSGWNLHYGPGDNPTSWKLLGSGESNVFESALGEWDTTSRLWGRYSLRIEGTDDRGNTANGTIYIDLYNSSVFTQTLPNKKWSMVALPGIPVDSDPRSFLVSPRYEIQKWDSYMQDNEKGLKYYINFPVYAGDAFWVKPYRGDISYTVTAWVPDTTKNFEINMQQGWNQVGMPYNRMMSWNQLSFIREGDTSGIPLGSAVSNGWLNSVLYSYSDNNYVGHSIDENMTPFVGYFVKANVPGKLLVDPGAGMSDGVARIVRPVYEWRLQIAAETDEVKDTENFAGELRGANEYYGKEDSAEPPGVEPYISVYFPHDDWGMYAGRYASDIRNARLNIMEKDKTWPFVVKTSDPFKDASLSWPDVLSLSSSYDIQIRDETTGLLINPRTQGSYSFKTDGSGKRAFTILSKKVGSAEIVKQNRIFPKGWALFSVPLELNDTDIRTQLGQELKNITVYQYDGGNFYTPQSKESVDIQAGIGYWLYTDKDIELQLSGAEVKDSSLIIVPLKEGWNLIGNPFSTDLEFGNNISLQKNGSTVVLSEAIKLGWIDGVFYYYDKNAGRYIGLRPGGKLVPWTGYAIKTYGDCDLVVSK